MKLNLLFVGLILWCLPLSAQITSKPTSGELVIQELDFPDSFNPIYTKKANAKSMLELIFQRLVRRDVATGNLVPVLAKALPEIVFIDTGEYAGGLSMTFEIREEAVWDNGTPVTGADYEFTMKMFRNPVGKHKIADNTLYSLHDIRVDPINSKRVTIYSKFRSLRMIESFGGFVLPRYAYDPKGLISNISYGYLTNEDNTGAIMDNYDIQVFAAELNSEKYMHGPGVVGSGPYKLIEWGEEYWYGPIRLERKENWWGDKMQKQNTAFIAHPQKLTYKVLQYETAAKWFDQGYVDIVRGIPAPDVDQARALAKKRKGKMLSTLRFNYEYAVINTRDYALRDVEVRQAIKHIIDKKNIIDIVQKGKAEEVSSPVHPTKRYYVPEDVPQNLAEARRLLAKAGWEDKDNDGVCEKYYEGQKIDLILTLKVNADNEKRMQTAQLIKGWAAEVGLTLEIIAVDWQKMIRELQMGDYDIALMAWATSLGYEDLVYQYHSSQIGQGSNVMGIKSEELDQHITNMLVNMDVMSLEAEYVAAQKKIQELVPCVYLYIPTNNIIMSKRIANPHVSSNRIGFDPTLLRVK